MIERAGAPPAASPASSRSATGMPLRRYQVNTEFILPAISEGLLLLGGHRSMPSGKACSV